MIKNDKLALKKHKLMKKSDTKSQTSVKKRQTCEKKCCKNVNLGDEKSYTSEKRSQKVMH